ncbi:MAG: hypothetical protein ACFFB3_14965 [Candidatus Hodarchaeota archaeon]
MEKRVVTGFLMLLMLIPLSSSIGEPAGAKNTTTFDIEWERTFGGPEKEGASAMLQTADGGYALAGGTESFGAGNGDFWLVKTDASGQLEWNQTFGGYWEEGASSVLQTADGGYILAGATVSYGAGATDFWLVKTDASGQLAWNQTFGGPEEERASSLLQTADGGYILAGATGNYPDADFWLVKTDASGKLAWNQTFGGPEQDGAMSVCQTADGGYVLAGGTDSFGAGNGDIWLVKTDASGQMVWNQTFGGAEQERVSAVRQTADGGYVLSGGTNSYGAGNSDFWLVKADASGQLAWNQTFGGAAWDNACSVRQTADGGYVLAGVTTSYGAGNGDFWLVKTDASGQVTWNQTFGGKELDSASAVLQTADGGYVLAGSTNSYGAGKQDMWLIKISEAETTEDSPSWTAAIVLISLTTLLIFRKRKKHR